MLSSDLVKLEKRLRLLASSGGSPLAMARLHLRGKWLQETIAHIYRSTATEAMDSLSAAEATALRDQLRRMQVDVATVAEKIPFERKLKAYLRPLTTTFQSVFLLQNAVTAGIAALSLKLDGEQAIDLSGIPASREEVLEVRARMLEFAPGWAQNEMGLYDQL